jgi:type VI protein secretion system component VasF
LKQGESERLEEYDRQLGQRLGQEEEEEGDRYHPTTRHPRHGRRRHWFRGAVQAMWYLLLAAAAVSAVYHLLLAT